MNIFKRIKLNFRFWLINKRSDKSIQQSLREEIKAKRNQYYPRCRHCGEAFNHYIPRRDGLYTPAKANYCPNCGKRASFIKPAKWVDECPPSDI